MKGEKKGPRFKPSKLEEQAGKEQGERGGKRPGSEKSIAGVGRRPLSVFNRRDELASHAPSRLAATCVETRSLNAVGLSVAYAPARRGNRVSTDTSYNAAVSSITKRRSRERLGGEKRLR